MPQLMISRCPGICHFYYVTGNGSSDKPGFLRGRPRWWTIDDYVEKDVPALIRFVLRQTNSHQVHFLGHSMGGMILCGVMARVDTTTAKIRSCIAIGSGLFLEGEVQFL